MTPTKRRVGPVAGAWHRQAVTLGRCCCFTDCALSVVFLKAISWKLALGMHVESSQRELVKKFVSILKEIFPKFIGCWVLRPQPTLDCGHVWPFWMSFQSID